MVISGRIELDHLIVVVAVVIVVVSQGPVLCSGALRRASQKIWTGSYVCVCVCV